MSWRRHPKKAVTTEAVEFDAGVLERFDIGDAALLSRRGLLRRTDSKFMLPAAKLESILEPLASDYALLLAGDSKMATYRTLYFDTPGRVTFHDHRRGRRPRHKVRIRHYDDRAVTFLEVKTKRSELLTTKARLPVPHGDSTLTDEGRAFVAQHCSLPAAELVPAVWTNFTRLTLLGLDINERITVDVGLNFAEAGGRTDVLGGVVIFEVKQSPFCMRTPVMLSLRAHGFRRSSGSKYCMGTAFMHPDLRNNRLLPILRAADRMRA